jgi:hypothetical protein
LKPISKKEDVMSVKTTLLVAVVVSGASLALAQVPRVPAPVNQPAQAPPILPNPQVTGTITLKDAPRASARDACSKFVVTGMEPTPASTTGGGIAIPGGKELAAKGHATGNILQGRCQYLISGLPTGREIYVAVRYTGPLGERGNATPHFTLAPKQHLSHDVQVSFTQVK